MMNQIILTIDIVLALVAVFVNLVFAILVLFRTSRAALYVTFFFGCISVIVWNMGDFIFFLTETRFWFYFSLIGSGMAPALMFHIANVLVRPGRKVTFWIILAYIFSSLLALSSPMALLHSGIQKFVDGIGWNILYFVLLVPFLLISIFMVSNSILKAESQDEKSRLRYILAAFIIAVLTGITDLVQALKVPVPPLGHLGCVAYSSILATGILKHQAAYDIFAQMQTKLEFLAEMAAAIAHEIRNPLTSIKGASNLLASELKNIDLPNAQEYHDIITEEIERLNHILINFQYFTRPLKIEKESTSINEIIQKTVRLAEIGPMRIKIKQEYDENSPRVQADASLLKQVFLNLIKNAEEACGSEGKLEIKTEHVPPWIKISFSDNGPGIPPENLKCIFDPFFTTKPAGIGMGLAICQRIIQAHGGRMEVKNRLPKGAEFSILLFA
jgi:signal transduction histidine kinase